MNHTAGVFCAVVSHPADTIVSVLNKEKGSTFLGVAKNLGFSGDLTAFLICVLGYTVLSLMMI